METASDTLRFRGKRRDEDNTLTQSYVEMLNVMRRMFDLWGDPAIGEIIVKAERALGRR
jgi:hypothetical protein